MRINKITAIEKKIIPWQLILIFLLFSGGIILSGIFYYISLKKKIFKEQEDNLSVIASLKIGQIERWHSERLEDAEVIRNDKPLISYINHFFTTNSNHLQKDILCSLKTVSDEPDYSNLILTDTLLNIRLNFSKAESVLSDTLRKEMKMVLSGKTVFMSDLRRSIDIPYIHIDILIPLIDSGNSKFQAVGILILRIAPEKVLFPIIQSWPNISKSSETLLLRREGDSILYLNELRHSKNTALNLKLPLTNKNLLATKALTGFEGVTEGIDYRNITVVGSIHKISGLPWYMVAKVDQAEILSPLKRYVLLIILVVLLLILINASIFGFWIWQQRIKAYRQLLKNESINREAEEILQETNQYLSSLFNSANTPIVVWDVSFYIARFNHAFEVLSGYNAAELIGKKIDILFSGEKTGPWIGFDNSSVIGESMEPIEIEIQIKDGRRRILLWNYVNILDNNSKTVVATVAQGYDITERKAAESALFNVITELTVSEKALRASEMRFRSLYENVTLGLYRTTTDGKILMANPALVSMLGFDSIEQLVQRNLEQEGYEPQYPRTNFLDTMEKNGRITGLESAWKQKSGKTLFVRESAIAIMDDQGRVLYYDGTVEDITERKKAEEALHDSEDKFKYIFNHSLTGISITYLSDELKVNRAFCDMLGYSHEELENTKWQDITYSEDIESTRNIIDSLIAGERNSARYFKRYLHKNGSVVWTEVASAIRWTEDGKPLYLITSVNNVTDRKKAEAELQQLNDELEQKVNLRTELLEAANKELEAFSYSVSHDLRSPLRSIHSFTKILLEEYDSTLDEEGKRICSIIFTSAVQMGELIDDLLSFSRIGRSDIKSSLLDMKNIAGLIYTDLTSDAERSRINFKIKKLQNTFGDASLIKLVWNNLISNAIKYSSKENTSEILIGSRHDDHSIVYFIKDNGVGFDSLYKHKLFGVFQRLHTESEFPGNGVGLAIIQRIVLRHGGKTWAEGEVGKGATFFFSLPDKEVKKNNKVEAGIT